MVIISPTPVFYAFLASQLPKEKLPPYHLLQVDKTCFLMPYFQDETETLDYVVSCYSDLFLGEIKRWLGANASNPISDNYSDFVCCFNLAFHTFVFSKNHLNQKEDLYALVMHPKESLYLYLKKQETRINWKNISFDCFSENGTAVLLPISDINDALGYLAMNYQMMIGIEKNRLGVSQFPDITSLSELNQFYSYSLHQRILGRELVIEGVV
jgi:hypothetical protein